MRVKDYLQQGYRLEHRIRLVQAEIEELRELSTSVSSPGFEEHHNASRNTDAPYEKLILKIVSLEEKQAAMLEKLLSFKAELTEVIDSLEDKDERLVIHFRYIGNKTWVEIGDKLGWDARTVRRWHNKALAHLVLPETPTIIDKNLQENENGT